MTRPDGPAVPSGPSEGDRIAREWEEVWTTPLVALSAEERADLARRIDAALAEAQAELKEVEAYRATPLKTIRDLLGDHDSPDEAIAGTICATILSHRELAKRKRDAEAMVAALRSEVEFQVSQVRELNSTDPKTGQYWGPGMRATIVRQANESAEKVLTSTADAAARFVERIQAEERERACQAICGKCKLGWHFRDGQHWIGRDYLVAQSCEAVAIRALGPQGGE